MTDLLRGGVHRLSLRPGIETQAGQNLFKERVIPKHMDLNAVIAELRAELESVKEVTAALEKLVELRHPGQETSSGTAPQSRSDGKPKRSKAMGEGGLG